MARNITGKLVRDARLLEGKESDGGRLHLRGETVTVDADCAELVSNKAARRRKPTRDQAKDKQAVPEATK